MTKWKCVIRKHGCHISIGVFIRKTPSETWQKSGDLTLDEADLEWFQIDGGSSCEYEYRDHQGEVVPAEAFLSH